MKFPKATFPIAVASAVSLAAQALFSLLMLRLFAPQAVGEFSVISQIAFFWMTLALAQSPLKLLADLHHPAVCALRAALRGSLLRLVALLPLAWAAVQFSGLARASLMICWATALALLQLCWYLAQPFTLRTRSTRAVALGRAAPPFVALVIAGVWGSLWLPAGSSGLLLAATSGYAVGALWLLPSGNGAGTLAAGLIAPALAQADSRSAALRLSHSAADALAGVAIVLIWQRSYGAAEAGCLAVLLRVLGFMPALIHSAWAQVLLAQGSRHSASPLWVGLTGAIVTALLGLACASAVQLHWLSGSWTGMVPYVLPMVLWQSAACLLAACSHLPFQLGRASAFSYTAIGFDALQILTLGAPLALGYAVEPIPHVWWVGGISAAGLFGLSFWLSRRPL